MRKHFVLLVAAVVLQLAWLCQAQSQTTKQAIYIGTLGQASQGCRNKTWTCMRLYNQTSATKTSDLCADVKNNKTCILTSPGCTEDEYLIGEEVACLSDSRLKDLVNLAVMYKGLQTTNCDKEFNSCGQGLSNVLVSLSRICVIVTQEKSCLLTAEGKDTCKQANFKYETFRSLTCGSTEIQSSCLLMMAMFVLAKTFFVN